MQRYGIGAMDAKTATKWQAGLLTVQRVASCVTATLSDGLLR